jgi:FkbM family methyltransferase
MQRVVRSGDVAYDIGANLGLHMALLSRLVGPSGRVLAFEPNPALRHLLDRTARGAGNCRVHAVALSDVTETATLFVPEDHSMGSLADWTNGRRGRTRHVACRQVQLDDLIAEGFPVPDFIKCDVEGAELKVFRGARQTINRASAPIVLFEAGENTSRGFGLTKWAALDFLAGMDGARFTFFEVRKEGGLEPLDRTVTTNLNVLAVPEARRERLDPR